jgi:uncharacterized membrane protein
MAEPGKFVAPAASLPDKGIAGAAARPSPYLDPWHKPVFILCLVCWVGNMVFGALRIDSSPAGPWLEGLFLVFATLSTLLALGRRLPLQNILATAVIIAAISGAVISLASVSGIPFGPIHYLGAFGEKIFEILPWPVPLGWIFLIVNGRGIARLIMRPWRKTNYYGFWVIGLTCLLAVVLDLGLEPFAVYVKDYWIWLTPKRVADWYTAPWVNFLGWFVTALAILVFSLPWLINKQPVKQPMDYQPLVLWLMLNIWIGAGNALHHLWPAVGVSLLANGVVTVYAIRGARW